MDRANHLHTPDLKIEAGTVFFSVVQESHDAVIISDQSGFVLFWNKAACRMFEFEVAEAVGKDFHDLICPEALRDQAKRSIARFIQSAGASNTGMVGKTVTLPALRKFTHTPFYVELSISSVTDVYGKLWIYAFLRDVTTRVLNEQTLQHQANSDELTKIANRRGFQRYLESNTDQSVTLCLFDLDHFKKINDQYGHDTGDLVLCFFCSHFLQKLSGAIVVARNGGEEFSALYRGDDIHAVIKEIEYTKELYQREFVKEMPIPLCTFSVGISATQALNSHRLLLKNADIALYKAKAKANGRNRIEAI